MLKFISLCSGIEAASVAFPTWKPVAFAENDVFCSLFLASKYPDVPNLGDITKVDWTHLEGVADIVVGGPPCQAFSLSGLRKSLDDPRGQLTLEYVQIVNKVKPPLLFYEQVPNILSAKDNAFGCLLAGLLGAELPLKPNGKRWERSGFLVGASRAVAWRVLDAQHFGVPQRRRRLFLIGFDFRNAHRLVGATSNQDLRRLSGIPAAVLFEPESSNGSAAQSRQTQSKNTQRLERDFRGSRSGCVRVMGFQTSSKGYNGFSGVVPTLTTRCSNGPSLGQSGFGVIQDIWAFSYKNSGKDVGRILPTLRAGSHKNSHANGGVPPAVAYTLNKQKLVRKLTPVECLRAQGFPGDYLDFPYKGNAKAPEGLRYKATGNSWAVPVVAWIGDRLDKVIAEVRASFQ